MPPETSHSTTAPASPERSQEALIVIGPTEDWCKHVAARWQKSDHPSQSVNKVVWEEFLYYKEELKVLLDDLRTKQPRSGTILIGWRPPNRILWEKQLLVLNDALPKPPTKNGWKKLGIHISPQGFGGVAMRDDGPAALEAGIVELCDTIEDAVTIGGWRSADASDLTAPPTQKLPQDFHSRIRHLLLALQDLGSTRDREATKSSIPIQNQFIVEMIREIQSDKQIPPAMKMLERWSAARLLAAVLARESHLINDESMTKTIDSVLGSFQSPEQDVEATANDYLTIAAMCLVIDPRDVKAATVALLSEDPSEILIKNPELVDQKTSNRLVEVHREFLEFIKHNEAIIDNYRIAFDVERNGITIRKALPS